jgi:hypothetical protein
MKISRVVIVVLVVVVVAVVGLYAFAVLLAPSAPSSAAWNSAAEFPLQLNGAFGVAGQQCLGNETYVYCIGGQDVNGGPRNNVYSSSALSPSSGNVTRWTLDSNHYPQNINGQACVVYSGYVYCVGGIYDDGGDDVASSYYARLDSGGAVGDWNSTTAYPIPIDTLYCAAWSGNIYCVGGNNETDGTNADSTPSNSVWYAPLSASGIGSWILSKAYPQNDYFPSCYAAAGFMYCFGGIDSNGNPLSTDYFAALTSTGVGVWTQTTAYPIQATGQACAISSGFIYCVGGQKQQNSYTSAVYYASASSAGIGAWKQESSYPLSVETYCAVSSGYMYCVGGFDSSSVGENGAVYYASLGSLSGTTT